MKSGFLFQGNQKSVKRDTFQTAFFSKGKETKKEAHFKQLSFSKGKSQKEVTSV